MDWLIPSAYAMGDMGGGAGGGQGQGGGLTFLFPLLLIGVVFYFLLIRPQQRAEKKRKEMLANVKKGWRVITAGGLRGTVVKLHEREKIVVVTIAPNVDVEVALVKIEAAAPPGEPLGVEEAGKKSEPPKDAAGPKRLKKP